MLIKVFCVYDVKVEAYLQPFFMQSKGQALRGFIDTVNDPSTQFNKHPEDFVLFEIGSYDDSSAELKSIIPVCIAKAHEVLVLP